MDSLDGYFELDESSAVKIAKNVASSIYSGKHTILQLMEKVHGQLTDKDSEKRLKSLQLIAKVLSYLKESCLTPNQCSVLIEFLCCKLEDHFSLHPPTLNALLILSSRTDLEEAIVEKLSRTIFKEVHTQSYMQSERFAVFEILTNLVDGYFNVLKKHGDDFVYGTITAVDGEQDPRNLLKVFDLMHSVIKGGFNVTKFAEEFFDVVGCYFPIDFEPPSNLTGNKTVVTNAQLVTGLRKVLTSSPVFAPYFFPLMIEKIESDVSAAKIDALETLRASLKVHSAVTLNPYLKSIWLCLHREAVEGVSKDNEELTLDLIKDIVFTISKSSRSRHDKTVKNFLRDMMQICLPCITKNLLEKKVWSSGRLLISAAEASHFSCGKIVLSLMPVLLKLLDNSQVMIAEKRLAMELIVCCLKAISMHNFDEDVSSHPIAETKQTIIELFCKSTSSKEFLHLRTVALAGIAALCNLGMIISPEDQVTVAYTLVSCLQYETDNMIFKDLFITMGFMSSKWPDVVLSHVMPALKEIVSKIHVCKEIAAKRYVDALCSVSVNLEVSTVSCDLLLNNITEKIIDEKTASPVLLCLDGICTVVKQNSENSECVSYFFDALVLQLVTYCVKLSLLSNLPQQCCMTCNDMDTSTKECITWPIMEKVCEIIRTVSQKTASKDRSNRICEIVSSGLVNSDLEKLGVSGAVGVSFDPFHNTMLPLQTRLVTLPMSTLPVLAHDWEDPTLLILMKNMITLALESSDQHTYVSASKCIAGLLNKKPNEDLLNRIYEEGTQCVLSSDIDVEKRTAAICLIVWILKALVLRCHAYSMKYCEVLFQLFDDERLGKMAADSFDIIFRTPAEILNGSCHACIRLMHKQWFFQLVLPRLKEGFQSMTKDDMDIDDNCQNKKANYLTALSHLLRHLPQQVLHQHLSSLLPLLVKSLSSDEGPLLVSVLSTLHNLMQDAESSLLPHVSMLIERFAQLASFAGDMRVRVQALKCIGVITILPIDVVLPYKRRVIRELSACLDDKKRLVRKEAATARTEWCLLGDV